MPVDCSLLGSLFISVTSSDLSHTIVAYVLFVLAHAPPRAMVVHVTWKNTLIQT